MQAVLDEIGIDASKHKSRTLDELEEYEGLNFDLIISLSPEAHHAALELTRTIAAEVEYWPTPDPTIFQGSRDQVRSEEHTSELQSRQYLVCRLLLEKKKTQHTIHATK